MSVWARSLAAAAIPEQAPCTSPPLNQRRGSQRRRRPGWSAGNSWKRPALFRRLWQWRSRTQPRQRHWWKKSQRGSLLPTLPPCQQNRPGWLWPRGKPRPGATAHRLLSNEWVLATPVARYWLFLALFIYFLHEVKGPGVEGSRVPRSRTDGGPCQECICTIPGPGAWSSS